jgi:uncharacterized membrane protein
MAESFAQRLRQETTLWVRDGLVSAEQAEAIVARYRYSERGPWYSRPIAIFSLLGGVLLVGGFALLVAHNWAEIPRWARLGGLVALLLAAHAGGLVLRARDYAKTGEGLFVLGGGLLLVGIALVGQFYNLTGRPSDAILLWWALLLPAAYALPSMALVGLAWFGASLWFALLIYDRTTWLGRDIAMNSALAAVAVGAAGVLAWALGAIHGSGAFRRARQFLEQLGLLVILVALVPLGFHGLHGGGSSSGDAGRWPVAALGLLLVAAVAVGAATIRLPPDRPLVLAGLASAFVLVVLYLFLVVWAVVQRAPIGTLRALDWANWALLFAVALTLILYGARWDRTSWVNWGIVWVGVDAVARYLGLFGTMLQTSALFFATGLFVLAVGGALELLRRRVTARAAAPREST